MIPTARSFARTITAGAIGKGPNMAVSRGSSDSESQATTATRAMTIIAIDTNVSRSPSASNAVRPGDWNGMKTNFIEIRMLRKLMKRGDTPCTTCSNSGRNKDTEVCVMP